MRYTISFTSTRVFRILLVIIFLLFCAGLLATYLSWVLKYEVALGFIPMFNLDGEFNMPAIFTVSMIATNALLLFFISKHTGTEANKRKYWRILGFIFLYLAFDEMTGTHERIGGAVYRLAPDVINASQSRYWMLPIGTLLVGFAVYLFRFYWNLVKRTKLNFTLAGLVYIIGAMGIEYLGDMYIAYNLKADVYYGLLACLEEVFEMTGMALFLRALLLHLQTLSDSRYFNLQFSIGGKEKSDGVTSFQKTEQPATKP